MLNVPEIAAIVSPRSRSVWAIQTHEPSSSRSGKVGKPDARHVELDVRQAVVRDRVERLLERRPRKRLGEDPQVHQTPPVTSSSRTYFAASTDRAMATIACTAARPSSRVAPACGAPSRIVAAKPSICSL